MSKWIAIRKPGQQAQSTFRMGKDSLEKGSEQTTGRQGAGRYNFQRQKPSQVTGAGTRRRGQGQKVTGDPSEKSAGK